MRRKLAVLVIVSLIMISALSSCGLESSNESKEKVFRYAVNNVPTTLDPNLSNGITDNEFQHVLTEGLTRTIGGAIRPGIAESWEVSEDGTVYTFHLRDANWSDGVPVTAEDFAYGWRRLLDPEVGSSYAFAGWMIKGGKQVNLEKADPDTLGIEVIDDKTLRITLEAPTAYFLSYIGSQPHFAPVRKDIVEKYGSDYATSPETNVYCGPFVLSYADNSHWTFVKNPEFWDADNIRIDRTEAVYTETNNEQVALFEKGELDLAYVPNDQTAEYKGQKNVNHFLNGLVDYGYINTKCSNKALRNRSFRLALNYALNRKLYNHKAFGDSYMPYNALVFPRLNAKDEITYGEEYAVDSYAFPIEGEVDLARAYLRQAMKKLHITDPSEINVEITYPYNSETREIAKELKSQWEDILGITVNLRTEVRSYVYSHVYPEGDYEIGLTAWAPDYNDPYTYLEIWRSDNTAYTPYGNPEVDALLDKSLKEPNLYKRMDMLNEAEMLLLEDAAVIPLDCKDKYYILNPKVQDLTLSFCNITIDWAYAGIAD